MCVCVCRLFKTAAPIVSLCYAKQTWWFLILSLIQVVDLAHAAPTARVLNMFDKIYIFRLRTTLQNEPTATIQKMHFELWTVSAINRSKDICGARNCDHIFSFFFFFSSLDDFDNSVLISFFFLFVWLTQYHLLEKINRKWEYLSDVFRPFCVLNESVKSCAENCSEQSADRYIELFIWPLSLSFPMNKFCHFLRSLNL